MAYCEHIVYITCNTQNLCARHGSVEVAAGLLIGRSGFNSQHTLNACGPSDGKEVNDIPGLCQGKLST